MCYEFQWFFEKLVLRWKKHWNFPVFLVSFQSFLVSFQSFLVSFQSLFFLKRKLKVTWPPSSAPKGDATRGPAQVLGQGCRRAGRDLVCTHVPIVFGWCQNYFEFLLLKGSRHSLGAVASWLPHQQTDNRRTRLVGFWTYFCTSFGSHFVPASPELFPGFYFLARRSPTF